MQSEAARCKVGQRGEHSDTERCRVRKKDGMIDRWQLFCLEVEVSSLQLESCEKPTVTKQHLPRQQVTSERVNRQWIKVQRVVHSE